MTNYDSITSNLPIGYILNNNYRIERVLGQGGFGITYLAIDLGLDRYVAIKEFFPKEYCERDSATSHITVGTQNNQAFIDSLKTKFIKEARNIAKLNHSGIIKIYTAFEDNNTAYYVMEYIDGYSAQEKIKKSGPFSDIQALKYVNKIGEALIYLHSKHINHLDVKPANIMIWEEDDFPILIDFGLSKQYDETGNQTSTTPTGISHGYAPVEQYGIGGVSEFSPKTDLYSLGATFYFFITGKVPPQATTLYDEDLSFPPNFPEQFKASILKAMSPARKNRQETINQFLEELNEAHENDCTKVKSEQFADENTNLNDTSFYNTEDINTYSQEADDFGYESEDKSSNKKKIIGIIIAVLLLGGIITYFTLESDILSSNSEDEILLAEPDSLATENFENESEVEVIEDSATNEINSYYPTPAHNGTLPVDLQPDSYMDDEIEVDDSYFEDEPMADEYYPNDAISDMPAYD